MKSKAILTVLIFVCAFAWGKAQGVSNVDRSLGELRTSLDKIEKLKQGYDKNPKDNAAYVSNVLAVWNKFRSGVASLKGKINFAKLSTNKANNLNEWLKQLEDDTEAANKKINVKDVSVRQISDGINNYFFGLQKVIEDISSQVSGSSVSVSDFGDGASPTPAPTKLPVISSSQANGGQQAANEGKGETSILSYLPYAIAILLALFGLSATFLFLNRRIAAVERLLIQQNQDSAQVRQNVTQQLDGFWDDYQKQRNLDKQSQQAEYSRLQSEIERLRMAAQSAKPRHAAMESPTIRRREEPSVERVAHVPVAPKIVSATEYLAHAGNNAIRAKAVMFRPEILQQANDDGPFVLLPDDGTRNIYKVLPGVPRFQSSQDYSHFAYFYDCDQPSSGELLILEPALAAYDESAGQWTLKRKGRLQIS